MSREKRCCLVGSPQLNKIRLYNKLLSADEDYWIGSRHSYPILLQKYFRLPLSRER